MAVPYLEPTQAIDNAWGQLVYTRARVKHDPNARDLLPQIEALIERCKQLRTEQLGAWEGEIDAQAGVDAANDALDATTVDFGRALDNEIRDRRSPAYKRYFAVAPSDIVVLGLESELERVRSWPDYLAGEESATLEAFGDRFREHIAAGDDAVEARRMAAAARANHRATAINRFFDDVNGARQSLHALLTQRAVERRLGRHWADRFFRHGSTPRRQPDDGDSN
jgi:hypothetical protein